MLKENDTPPAPSPGPYSDQPERDRPLRRKRSKLRSVLTVLGVILLLLVVLLTVGLFVLPRTDVGRGLVDRIARPIVEDAVEKQLGSEIDFAPLRGALPGELIIDDLSLSEGGSVWFSADRVRLDWSPLALLRRDIVVEELAIRGAELHRQPPPFPEQPPKPEEQQQPLNLPSIRVDRLVIDPFTLDESVLGEAYVVGAIASVRARGQDVAAEAELATTSGSDRVDLTLDYDPKRLAVSLDVAGRDDGLIATLSKAGGPVTVSLDGEGPLSGWGGTLDAEIGTYGGAQAQLTGDLRSLRAASFAGTIRPGTGLPDIAGQLAGDALAVDIATEKVGDALIVQVEDLSGRFGRVGGLVRLSSLSAEEIAVDLSGRLSRDVASEFGADPLAGPLRLKAEAARLEEGWTFDADLKTPELSLNVEDGSTGAEAPFQGKVLATSSGLTIGNERLDPILSDGLRLAGVVDYDAAGTAAIADLDARIGQGATALTATGEARFETESQRFDADLDLEAARSALEQLLGTGTYDGPLTASVQASGTPQDAAVELSARFPAGRIEEAAFGAGSLRADLTGLPGAPAGEAVLRSTDDSYQGRLIARSRGEVIDVATLTFASGGISLDASGQVNPDARSADIAVALDAGEETTLITGQTIGGTAQAQIEVGADGGPVDIAVLARDLVFEDTRINAAQITARGPLNAVDYGVSLDDAALPGGLFLALLNTSGTADVATPQRRVAIDELRAAVDSDTAENTVTLLDPTTVEFGEVIALNETRLDWLDDGTITAEGRYAPDLWVARVAARDVSLPGVEASADIDLDVDTREPTPGRVSLTATTPGRDEQAYTLSLDGAWSGERLTADASLARAGTAQVARAELALPVVLTRTGESLGLDLPENGLEGRIRYDDRLAPLYAFLPIEREYLTGQLDADVTLSGSVASPEARGTVRLSDGRFEEETYGFTLRDVTANADLSYTGTETAVDLTLNAADARGRQGAVAVTGEVDLGTEASSVDVRVALENARLSDTAELTVQTDGEVSLTGALDALTLAGEINIDELDAQIPSIEGDDAPDFVPVEVVRTDGPSIDRTGEVRSAPEPPFEIALDMRIEGNNAVFVRGRGLESEWQVGLDIGGTTIAPIIGGDVVLLDGTFDFAGREFELTRGRVDFQRGEEIDPRLDIQAAYEAGEGRDAVTAIVSVTGPASDPQIELSSNPPRPQEDVMALILFGKQPTELTALESLQIANAVAQLTGTGPFGGGGPGISDKLRTSLGLDALSVGVGDDGQGVLGIGKYITDDIYVSARQSVGDVGTEVVVTYEVTPSVTVESRLKPNGAQGVSANYKRDY